jgi:hypothetical protein
MTKLQADLHHKFLIIGLMLSEIWQKKDRSSSKKIPAMKVKMTGFLKSIPQTHKTKSDLEILASKSLLKN